MTYYYRPGPSGMGKLQHPRTHHANPLRKLFQTPRPLPNIPWRYVGIGIAVLILGGGGYFGITKFQSWSGARRQTATAKRESDNQAQKTALEQSMRSQITTALGAAGTWQQKMQDNKAEEAEVAAKIALELQPNWRDGYLMMGTAQLAQKEYKDAQNSLETALKLDPTNPPTHQLLAALFNQTGHKDIADQETEKAINLSEKTGIQIGG